MLAIGDLHDWIVDSGATCHISYGRDAFMEFNANQREKTAVANGHEVIAEGKGTIVLNFLSDQNVLKKVRMNNVLFVPEIGGNIISVRRLAERGFKVDFLERNTR